MMIGRGGDEKEKDRDLIEARASQLGLCSYNADEGNKAPDGFGLCSSCKLFQFARTEFSVIFAKCAEFEIPLSSQRPVTDCSGYVKRGALTLMEMYGMAADIKPAKDKVGF